MVFVGGLEADEGADGGLAVVAGGEECGRVQAVVVTRVARFGRRMPLERPRPRLRFPTASHSQQRPSSTLPRMGLRTGLILTATPAEGSGGHRAAVCW